MRITRRTLLGALGALLATPARGGGGRPSRLVTVHAPGGWDTSLTLDPKHGSPHVDQAVTDPDEPLDTEAVRRFDGLTVGCNDFQRPAVSAFFERWAPKTLLVRGLAVGSIAHQPAQLRMLTGGSDYGGPDLGAIVGQASGAGAALGYLDLAGHARFGPFATAGGRVGSRHQLGYLLDPTLRHEIGTPSALDPVDRAVLESRMRDRARGLPPHLASVSDALDASAQRSAQLRRAEALKQSLSSGGRIGLSDQASLLAQSLQASVCRAALLSTSAEFDTHDDNWRQQVAHDGLFEDLDVVITALDDAGLLDQTLVVVLSELGRTPLRNQSEGKDHWPVTSAMVIGGGIAGGRTIGATDDFLLAHPIDLVTGAPDPDGTRLTYEHFAAGILEAVGVSSRDWLPSASVLPL